MKKTVFTLLLFLTGISAFNQSTDNYIMEIDGRKITSEEFLRVYNKNNNITPETEKKTIDEYLDLFINYKLKVIEAENLGYDTVKSFVDEFSGYREQLAKPYLQNEALKESLVKEAYDRYAYEIRASHILISCPADATAQDSAKAYKKAMEIRARVKAGEPFSEVAKATSDDPSVKENGGDLGYFSVFRMVYPFETGAYNTPVGEISLPIRTRFGYHLIKVVDKRENRGSVKAAHIMTRISKNASPPEQKAAKDKIYKAYKALMDGEKWDDAVAEFSENPRTKNNKGEIGWLQVGQAPIEFLNACYDLQANGFSKPIKTAGGFHIAYLLDKKPIESYEEVKEKLANRVDNDNQRKETLKKLMNSELVKKYNVKINRDNAFELVSLLDSSIYEKHWDSNLAKGLQQPVMTINNSTYTQFELAQYLAKQKRKSKKDSFQKIVAKELDAFSEIQLKSYALKMLPKENPDYRYLLQEYHDGILLFNLTNEMVWQKAQEDTSGLETFYKTAEKYYWNDRLEVGVYEYENNNFTAQLPKIAKKQQKKNLSDDFLLSSLCPDDTVPCIHHETKMYEKGQDAITDKFTWKKGTYTSLSEDDKNYFYYVQKVLPRQSKKLSEARGMYIADYQNYLETQWIAALRNKYETKINQEELNKIKSELN